MPICSPGVSQPIPGLSDDVIITSTLLAASLPAGALWLEPFIGGAAALIDLHLPAFCATDPPADPGVTAADVLAVTQLIPSPATFAAQDKIAQLLQRFLWYSVCQCSTIATP